MNSPLKKLGNEIIKGRRCVAKSEMIKALQEKRVGCCRQTPPSLAVQNSLRVLFANLWPSHSGNYVKELTFNYGGHL